MGQTVWLICGYDLEGEILYSVKWYKNNVEFYRFLPNDRPFGQTYDMLGVHLSVSKNPGSLSLSLSLRIFPSLKPLSLFYPRIPTLESENNLCFSFNI